MRCNWGGQEARVVGKDREKNWVELMLPMLPNVSLLRVCLRLLDVCVWIVCVERGRGLMSARPRVLHNLSHHCSQQPCNARSANNGLKQSASMPLPRAGARA